MLKTTSPGFKSASNTAVLANEPVGHCKLTWISEALTEMSLLLAHSVEKAAEARLWATTSTTLASSVPLL